MAFFNVFGEEETFGINGKGEYNIFLVATSNLNTFKRPYGEVEDNIIIYI